MVWVLVLGAILVGALFVLPSALKAGSETWSSFWKDFWLPFTKDGDNATDGNGNNNDTDTTIDYSTTGSSGLGLTITYTDGKVESFKPNDLALIGLAIWDAKGFISSVSIKLYMTATYTGVLTAVNVAGTFEVIHEEQNYKAVTANIDKTSSLQSNVETPIWSITFSKAEIESWTSGSHINFMPTFRFQLVSTKAKFTWSDQHTETAVIESMAKWLVSYAPDEDIPMQRLSSLSVSLKAGPIYIP